MTIEEYMEYPMEIEENEQCFECKGKGIVPSRGCDSELNNGYDECYACSGKGWITNVPNCPCGKELDTNDGQQMTAKMCEQCLDNAQ